MLENREAPETRAGPAGVEEEEDEEAEAEAGVQGAEEGEEPPDSVGLGFFRPCLITTKVSNPRAALMTSCRQVGTGFRAEPCWTCFGKKRATGLSHQDPFVTAITRQPSKTDFKPTETRQ